MLNAQVFFWSTQIITEGLALFFMIFTLYLLRSRNRYGWILAGFTMGLTFASRYPIFLQVLVIFIVQAIITRNIKLPLKTLITLVPTLVLIVTAVYLKTGDFSIAIQRDSTLSLSLSPFYIANSISTFGIAFILVPIVFFFRRTYTEKYNLIFIAWFVVAILFWSASPENQQERFMFQVTPAVYYLTILAIENIWKSNLISKNIKNRFKLQTNYSD
jgi:hypothetical protein